MMEIDDAIMETDQSDNSIIHKTKVIVMADSTVPTHKADSGETKDELNPSPPNEASQAQPSTASYDKTGNSSDDSDIQIIGECQSRIVTEREQKSPAMLGNGSLQLSTPGGANVQIAPANVPTIMQLPLIRPQPIVGGGGVGASGPAAAVAGPQFQVLPGGAVTSPVTNLHIPSPSMGQSQQHGGAVASGGAGGSPFQMPIVVGAPGAAGVPVSTGGMVFQLPQSTMLQVQPMPMASTGGGVGKPAATGTPQPGVMTISGSPLQFIQPNISITPKTSMTPTTVGATLKPMPAVSINPLDGSQKKSVVIKNPNVTFRTVSPENVKPFTGKIVRLSTPILSTPVSTVQNFPSQPTAAATIVPQPSKIINKEVSVSSDVSVSKQLELNEVEEEEDQLSLACNEQFDDSFEKKANDGGEAGDVEEDAKNNDDDDDAEVKIINEVAKRDVIKIEEGAGSVDLLKPLEPIEEEQSKGLDVKMNEFGMLEVEDLGLNLKKKEENSNTKPTHTTPRKLSMTRKIQDDEILYCEGCGCYGMAGEFVAQNSCSNTCNNIISARLRERQRREKELQILKQRRDEKKANLMKPGKKKGSSGSQGEEDSRPLPPVSTWMDSKKGFLWSKYLDFCGARSAPVRLFRDPFPDQHGFKEGMKMEAIDPLHQSLFCVVTVAEVMGARIRLHFDGFSESHDFWENCNSENIFPVGWCAKNSQRLSPPKGYSRRYFNWETYLSQTDSVAAPDDAFVCQNRDNGTSDSATQGWRVGMKLEACDRQNKSLVCVATVINVIQDRILLHFDGWELDYDYWSRPTSQNVKPVGWCSKNKKQLNPPKGNHPSAFSWSEYLMTTKSKPVPAWAFRSPGSFQNETDFQEGMRLEAVDVYNPRLLRVASIVSTEGRQIELHYDGWPDELNHWVEDDDPNIHPCGWAAKTGHPLHPPLTPQEVEHWTDRSGCSIPGCRGIGHIKGSKYTTHHSTAACPYAPQNLESSSHIADRLQGSDRGENGKDDPHGHDGGQPEDGVDGEDSELLGRGNRRRKKRKFFDEDTDGADMTIAAKKRSSLDDEEESSALDENLRSDIKQEVPGKITRRKGSIENKYMVEIKEEVEDVKPSLPLVMKREDAAIQTRTPSPLPFYTEWEEGVRKSVWQPGYLPQPYPQGSLPACWKEHSKLLIGGSSELIINRAKQWTIDQVMDFLGGIPNLDTGSLEPVIRDQEIDGEALLLLTQSDIRDLLGVKLGPAIKIYNAIMSVRLRVHQE